MKPMNVEVICIVFGVFEALGLNVCSCLQQTLKSVHRSLVKSVCTMIATILFVTYIVLNFAQLVQCQNGENSWSVLTVKFAAPRDIPNDPFAYNPMPMTCEEALKKGWTKMPANDLYMGDRVIKDDPSIVLIYCPMSGRMIGMQSQFPANEVTVDKWRQYFEDDDMFTKETRDGQDYYVLTAYTFNPDDMSPDSAGSCTKGVGCSLYFLRRGNKPWEIPMSAKNMTLGPNSWTKAKCVPGMGKHYLWNLSKNMKCEEFRPFFLLYNDGNLSGFGWQLQSHFKSKHLEAPPKNASGFFYTVPTCVPEVWEEVGGINSLHFYFNDNPKDFKCPDDDSEATSI